MSLTPEFQHNMTEFVVFFLFCVIGCKILIHLKKIYKTVNMIYNKLHPSVQSSEVQTSWPMVKTTSSHTSSRRNILVSLECVGNHYPLFEVRSDHVNTEDDMIVLVELLYTCKTKFFKKNEYVYGELSRFFDSLVFRAFNFLYIIDFPDQKTSMKLTSAPTLCIGDRVISDDIDRAEFSIVVSNIFMKS